MGRGRLAPLILMPQQPQDLVAGSLIIFERLRPAVEIVEEFLFP